MVPSHAFDVAGPSSQRGVSGILCVERVDRACGRCGKPRVAVFQVPVGAVCASAGTAASTRGRILRRRLRKAVAIQNRELLHRLAPVGAARAHVAVILRRASQISFVAASSFGKWPRVLMILRSCACTLSSAFVV